MHSLSTHQLPWVLIEYPLRTHWEPTENPTEHPLRPYSFILLFLFSIVSFIFSDFSLVISLEIIFVNSLKNVLTFIFESPLRTHWEPNRASPLRTRGHLPSAKELIPLLLGNSMENSRTSDGCLTGNTSKPTPIDRIKIKRIMPRSWRWPTAVHWGIFHTGHHKIWCTRLRVGVDLSCIYLSSILLQSHLNSRYLHGQHGRQLQFN